jgi:hypothetical protein
LFNGDFADGLNDSRDTAVQTMFANAANLVAASGHGYIGEFTGAVAALTSNLQTFASGPLVPLGLVSGTGTRLGLGFGGTFGSLHVTAAGLSSPIMVGVPTVFNPATVEAASEFSSIDSSLVLATFDGGANERFRGVYPGVIVRAAAASATPEPMSFITVLAGSFGLLLVCRKRIAAARARREPPTAA